MSSAILTPFKNRSGVDPLVTTTEPRSDRWIKRVEIVPFYPVHTKADAPMSDVLQVEKREKMGTAETRRLRKAGRVPAVLYGHGESNEHLSIPNESVMALIRHHSKTVELQGAVSETALVSDMQWDPLGIEVLHMDLVRVNLRELVEVTVPIHVRGVAPGTSEGGVLLENLHEVDIRCPAGKIPESLEIDVNELQLGQHRTAGELELPEKVELLTPEDTVIVHVEEPRVEPLPEDDAAAEAVESEPEVISKGGDEEGETEEG